MMTKETIKALRIELARHSGNIPGGSGFLLDAIETLQDANALLDSVYKSACERADQLQSRVQDLEKDKEGCILLLRSLKVSNHTNAHEQIKSFLESCEKRKS